MTMSTVSEDATSAASAGAGSNNNNVNKHDPVTPSGADIEHNVSTVVPRFRALGPSTA